MTVTGQGNYTDEVSKEWRIAPAGLTIKSVTLESRAYDGEKAVKVTSVTFDGLQNGENLTDYTVTGMMADADAGTDKTVTVDVTLKDTVKNYTLANGEFKDGKITIDKATYTGAKESEKDTKYGDTASVDLSSLIPDNAGKVTLGTPAANNMIFDEARISGKELTYKLKAGTAVVTITAAETDTYAKGTATVTVTVAHRVLTITAEDKTAYVGAQQPELTYKVDGLLEAGKEMLSDVTLSVSAPEGIIPMNRVGTYDIVVASATYDTGKYELTTENGTLTVRARHSSGTTTGSTGGVSVDRPANGTVTASPADPVKGSTVTITVTPDKGQTLKDIEVLDKSGNSLPLTDLGNGKFSFVMPEGTVTVKAEFGEAEAFVNPYNDVKPGDWYYSAVEYVTVNGLMNGTGKGFEPNLATSRAMIWTILARMSGADTASDGEWYAAAQQWAVANGVSGGTMPNGTITREQLAAMLYRYAVSKGMVKAPATADLSAFADAGSVSSYAVEAMQWAVSTGLMNGMDGKLAPQGSATRAQVTTMLMRFAELG